jgi:hypothetical protein
MAQAAPTQPVQPARRYLPPADNPNVDFAANERFMGRKGPNVPKGAEGAVAGRQSQIERALDDIVDDPNLTDPKAIANAVRGVSKELGQRFDTYLSGNLPQTTRQADQGWYDRIVRLGIKSGSSVGPETQKTRAAAMQSFARGGKNAQYLLALGTAARHLDNFAKDLGPEGKNAPSSLAEWPGKLRYIGPFFASKADREKAATLTTESGIALDELNRSLVGGVGAQRGRESVEALGKWAELDPAVTAKNIETARNMMRERIIELRDEFMAGVGGKPDDFIKMFDTALGNDSDSLAAREELRRLDQETKGKNAPAKGQSTLPPGWSIK